MFPSSDMLHNCDHGHQTTRWHLSWARHQLGIRVTWHFFKIQKLGMLIRPLQVDFLKLELRCLDVSTTRNVFCCSAKQRPLYSDTTLQTQVPLCSPPQPGGDAPGVPTIRAAAQSCAYYTLCTGAPSQDLKSSQALKPRPTPPRGVGPTFRFSTSTIQ